jgi:hypothetical protein
MNWPKHGDIRGGDRYDRPSMAWVRADEWQRRQWDREDRVFAKRANQGELKAPQIITDGQGGIRGVQSMLDGKMYDSKAAMRRHYRERGAIEVGDDSSVTSREKIEAPRVKPVDPAQEKKIDAALGRAWSRVGLGA